MAAEPAAWEPEGGGLAGSGPDPVRLAAPEAGGPLGLVPALGSLSPRSVLEIKSEGGGWVSLLWPRPAATAAVCLEHCLGQRRA